MAALTEEQALLKEQASDLGARRGARSRSFREMRDSGNDHGFDTGHLGATCAEIGLGRNPGPGRATAASTWN